MTRRPLTRRSVLTGLGALAAGAAVPGCSDGSAPTAPTAATAPTPSSASSTTAASSAPASASGSPPASGAATSGAAPATRSPAAGPDLTHGPRTRQAVALTFHGAGDVRILQRMLAEFKDAGAHVTVLAIGQWLATDPQVARLVLDGGHDLGNHTWSHRTMPRLAAADVRTEIARAAAELRTLTGSAGRWFRPSGTPASTPAIRAAAVANGYGACLGYDVDPLDYTDPGPDAVARAFAKAVRPGSVVSLHLGHPGTLAAMPAMLTTLHDRGLAAVTATDLLGT